MKPPYSLLSFDEDEAGSNGPEQEPQDMPLSNHQHQDIGGERLRLFLKVITIILFSITSIALLDIDNIDQKLFSTVDIRTEAQFLDLAQNSYLLISSVSNDYGVWDSTEMLPYPFLLDALLLEPYRKTAIALATPIKGCTYNWYITDVNNDAISSRGISTNGTIVTTLYSAGEYLLTVSENCTDISDSGRQLAKTVWVKYVRRELSTLLDNDREDFLDAFHTLWTVSTTVGQALYGDRYKSINYFATLHNDGGGNAVCDEFHGGKGFLNNHMYLSAYLEQSLQLINPAVALHYMEYGKYFESDQFQQHSTNQMDGGAWTSILSAKFFGTSDPYTGRIINSRWVDLKVPYMTSAFYEEEGIDPDHTFFPIEEKEWLSGSSAHKFSPYGLLRSPWNYNPSPYLSRFGNVYRINDTSLIGESMTKVFGFHMGVDCSKYTKFFKTVSGQPLEIYLSDMEDDTHGIFHFTFGGVGGDQAMAAIDILRDTYGFSYSNIGALAVSSQHYFKKTLAIESDDPMNCTAKPWQNNELLTTSYPGEVDGPKCDFADTYYESSSNLDELIVSFLNFDPANSDTISKRISEFDFSEKKAIMKVIANMFPFDGDLASSGAALDPLFWVAHGAMERTFQKSVFSNILSNMEWTAISHCSGHNAESTRAWLNGFYLSDESINTAELTNAELTAILDPTSDKYRDLVNFVYDTGSYSWCEDSESWFA